MGFIRRCTGFGAAPLVSVVVEGDSCRSGGVVGAKLLVDGEGGVDGIRVGSPLGFKGLKPDTF